MFKGDLSSVALLTLDFGTWRMYSSFDRLLEVPFGYLIAQPRTALQSRCIKTTASMTARKYLALWNLRSLQNYVH